LPLTGIIPPMVTPLSAPDVLDVAALERLIEHLVGGGCAGLFILGTTGEGPSLSGRLRRELIDHTCRLTRGRIPVLACITDTAFSESLDLAIYAGNAGVDAVVLAPPPYFPLIQSELLRYVQTLTPKLPLPLILYNMPAMTKISFEIETLGQLVDDPRIVGIKDSSGDQDYFARLIPLARARKDWCVLVGPEEMTASAVALGGHGGVNGGANVFPKLFSSLYHAAATRDLQSVARLQRLVVELHQMYRIPDGAARGVRGIKCALSILGLCGEQATIPFAPLEDAEREAVRELICQIGNQL